jgi:peptide/nickel transport system substrate-binding protein
MFHQDSLAGANTDQFSNWEGVPALQAMWWNVFSIGNLEANTDDRTAIWGAARSPTTLNPMGVDSGDANIAIAMAYDRLVRIGLDTEPQPWACTDWEWVDSTTLEMPLREDLTFHDGEPFTAEDVQFTMEYYLDWEVPYMSTYYEQIESVEVLDDYTVRFNLSSPNVAFVNIALAQLYILPKHIWDGVVDEAGVEHPQDWDNSPYVGSAPFEVRAFEPDDRLYLEVRDDDPRTEDWDIEELIWKVYGSQSAAVGDLQSGRISFVQALHPNNFQQVQDSPGVEAVAEKAHGYTRVELHTKTAPMSDKVFRQAIAHATDKEEIINVVFRGRADKATSPIAPVMEFWHNPDTPEYDGGVSEARAMLEEAGYTWDDDGTLLLPVDRFSDEELQKGGYL